MRAIYVCLRLRQFTSPAMWSSATAINNRQDDTHLTLTCYYCDDSLAEPDNNAAERAFRAVCLGKKNSIFFGSGHGGERGALLYGPTGTCRLNGIDQEAYLRHILSALPEWPSNKVAELLPWNVDLTNQ